MGQREEFEVWLADLSGELADVGANNWADSLVSILQRISKRFCVDELSLWQARRTGELRLYAQFGSSFDTQPTEMRDQTPWLLDLLTTNRTVQAFSSFDELPAAAASDRTWLRNAGLARMLLVPLRLDAQPSGQLLAVCRDSGAWPPAVRRQLMPVGGLLSNTLARLQAERAVRQEQARFMQLLRAAPDAVVVVRGDGCIEFVNDQAERMFGYRPLELHGQPVEVLVPRVRRVAHRKQRKNYAAAPLVRVMGAGGRLQAVHKSGALIPVEINLSPVNTDDGPMVTAIVRDITERMRTEEKVREQRNELARVSRIATVGELAGALAHELNQPLAAILSNAQAAQRFLRRREPDTEQVRQIITDIIDDDKRAAAVIHQMRRFLKHEEPELKQVEMNRLIGDTLRALQSDLAIHQVTVESDLADDLPLVYGNLVQLQQVVLNLVLNAVDAMQSVDHEDRVLMLATEFRDDMVYIAVRDTGSGIEQAIVRKIFGPFFTTKKDGMGMGLPITRSIVEAHGGQLAVANNEAGGCTFSVVLPLSGTGNSAP